MYIGSMQRIVEALIAKGRRTNKPSEQRDVALSLADISCKSTARTTIGKHVHCLLKRDSRVRMHTAAEDSGSRIPALVERIVTKGGVKTLLHLLVKSQDLDAQRFSALALANCASARECTLSAQNSVSVALATKQMTTVFVCCVF